MRKAIAAGVAIAAATLIPTTTAFACGGLVAPDGDVRLDKATTFVAWHDGVEHYVTSFAFRGSAVDVGWIVPLPAIPSSIKPAGRWTLQRLEREVQPPVKEFFGASASTALAPATVVEQVQIEALDVTVLKGTGQAVVDWCAHNGFALNQETRQHLLVYAQASPIFMAAKYDTAVAQQRGTREGDGVPLLITMPTSHVWVPLEVLANDDTNVNADIFLLTDNQLSTAASPFGFPFLASTNSVGAPGFVVAKQEQVNPLLHGDLSNDRNMSWVPSTGWLTYLTLNAPSSQVTYDLGVGSDNVIRLASFGTKPALVAAQPLAAPSPVPLIIAIASALTLALGTGSIVFRRTRRAAGLSATGP